MILILECSHLPAPIRDIYHYDFGVLTLYYRIHGSTGSHLTGGRNQSKLNLSGDSGSLLWPVYYINVQIAEGLEPEWPIPLR